MLSQANDHRIFLTSRIISSSLAPGLPTQNSTVETPTVMESELAVHLITYEEIFINNHEHK